MEKFHSKNIIHLYDKTYFLGGKSKFTGQTIGVEGYQDFKEGKIYDKKINCANMLDFNNKRVLDIGFGRGEILKYCKLNGAKWCTGIDYSDAAFEIAEEYAGNYADLFCTPFDELECLPQRKEFEVVYMLDTIEHITMPELASGFAQLMPYLTSDAEMLIVTPSVPSGDYLNMHCNYMNEEKFHTLLGKYFKSIKIENKNKWFYVICKGNRRGL